MIRFLSTRIGIAAVAAIVIVLVATATKLLSGEPGASELHQKVALIAAESVKKSLQEAADPLDQIAGTTTAAGSLEQSSPGAESPSGENGVTATDRFARELFTLYAQAKQSGEPIDELTAERIAELVLSNDYSGERALVTEADLKTTSDSSRARAKIYGNAVGAALAAKRPIGDQELAILERVREEGMTEDDARSLALILAHYRKIETSLKEIIVPKGAGSAHADLINGIDYLARGVEGILTLEADPVGSLTKIKEYEDGINLLGAGSLGLRSYLKSKNVTFSSDENGYNLTR